MRSVDGAAVRCGGHCRPDLPAYAHRPARVGTTGPGQRCWRPWEHKRIDRARPARWRRRTGRANATAGRAALRRTAAGGLGEFTSLARAGVGGRRKGRSRSDSFDRELSCPDRGFRGKGQSGSDTFRARAALSVAVRLSAAHLLKCSGTVVTFLSRPACAWPRMRPCPPLRLGSLVPAALGPPAWRRHRPSASQRTH
jgi:hypothetical protein